MGGEGGERGVCVCVWRGRLGGGLELTNHAACGRVQQRGSQSLSGQARVHGGSFLGMRMRSGQSKRRQCLHSPVLCAPPEWVWVVGCRVGRRQQQQRLGDVCVAVRGSIIEPWERVTRLRHACKVQMRRGQRGV